MTEIEVEKEARKDFELLIRKICLTEENSRDFKTSAYKGDQILVRENDTGPKLQIVTTSNPLCYNKLQNIKYETMTEQGYPSAQQIIPTGNPPHSVQSRIHMQSQQPLMRPDLYNYNQQQNQHFNSQHQMHVMPNRIKQFLVPFQSNSADQNFSKICAVQQQSQMINSPSNQQHFSPPQHRTTAYNSILTAASRQQYTNPPSPQQHITTSLTKCAIRATQPAIQQPSPVLPRNPTVVIPKNLSLPMTNATKSNGVLKLATHSNKLGVNSTQPKSANRIVPLPTTYSKVIDLSVIPVSENKTVKQSLRDILYNPRKGRDQSRLSFARRCVAGIKSKDLEIIDSDGDNYLHIAVGKTDVYMMEALLERIKLFRKHDMIDQHNNSLETPLYMAVSLNKPDMVCKLVSHGANTNIKGMTQGYTTKRVECSPIHCAASRGKNYCDTLKELFKSKNMDPDIMNSNGLSALHSAIIKHGELVSNQNCSVTKIDNCQNVSLLLRNKANPNLRDRCSGKTPLMYAIESKDYVMVDTILKEVNSSVIPELLQTETFDGQTCKSIADDLRNEFDPYTWKKLHNFLLA